MRVLHNADFVHPDFTISLTGYFLNEGLLKFNNVIDSLDGNICRCTGHSSIIRAAENLSKWFKEQKNSEKKFNLNLLVDIKIIPEYFLNIKTRLLEISEIRSNIPRI